MELEECILLLKVQKKTFFKKTVINSNFFPENEIPCTVTAVEINEWANKVYSFNFPETKVQNRNVQFLNSEFITKLKIDTILMSPPCQPFTRNGNCKDVEDARTDAFLHICSLLNQLATVERILMENVQGFEKSRAREIFIESLKNSGFFYQEFMLSPTGLGVPNSRTRYYCIARKSDKFKFGCEELLEKFPFSESELKCSKISEIIEEDEEKFLIPKNALLKRLFLLDIRFKDSVSSNCFTKAYTRYTEGTGSVFCPIPEDKANEILKKAKELETTNESEKFLECVAELNLRYFSPKEVSRLMSFPEKFDFPKETGRNKKYRLLGNSLNVKVVAELIKLLFLKE